MAMMRFDLLNKLITELKKIKTSSGYSTNLGNYVYTRYYAGDENKSYFLLVQDAGQSLQNVAATTSGRQRFVLDLRLKLYCVGPGASNQEFYNCIDDIYKCIGANLTLGGYCFDIQPAGDTITYDQDGKIVIACEMQFAVQYEITAWDY